MFILSSHKEVAVIFMNVSQLFFFKEVVTCHVLESRKADHFIASAWKDET